MEYIIIATVTRKYGDGSEVTTQVPTFYLDSRVQAIVDTEDARKVAEAILNPFGEYKLSVYAMSVDVGEVIDTLDLTDPKVKENLQNMVEVYGSSDPLVLENLRR